MSFVTKGKWKKKVTLRCTFCGGRLCIRCGPRAAKNQDPKGPVEGLHSNWVTDRLLACQRPSSRINSEYDLPGQFRKLGVNAVFNLQEPGEHPYCGDGIISSGFSYLPEEFMHEGILFYNFPWEDMTVPSLNHMLNIVKCMAYSIEGGFKIAVHCHAGYGRTGMAIACFLIYFRKWDVDHVLDVVRTARPGSVKIKIQVEFVRKFAEFVLPLQLVYALPPEHNPMTLEQALYNQYEYLHGQESRTLRWLPKIVLVLCSMLSEVADKKGEMLERAFQYVGNPKQWEQSELNLVLNTKLSLNRTRCWEKMGQNNSRVCVHLLLDWIQHLREPVFSPDLVLEFCHIVAPSANTSSSALGKMVRTDISGADGLMGLLGAADDARRDRLGGVLDEKSTTSEEGKLTSSYSSQRGLANSLDEDEEDVASYADDEGWDGPPMSPSHNMVEEGKSFHKSEDSLNGLNGTLTHLVVQDEEKPEFNEGSPFAHVSPRSPRVSPLMRSRTKSFNRNLEEDEEKTDQKPINSVSNEEKSMEKDDKDTLTLSDCKTIGNQLYSLVRAGAKPTITCIFKCINKISNLDEYDEVCEIVGGSLCHLETSNFESGRNSPIFSESHQAKKAIRIRIGKAVKCMAEAAREMASPETRHFKVDKQKEAILTLTDAEQRRALSDILALYKKLSLGRKNKALAALADLYGKAEKNHRQKSSNSGNITESKSTRRDAKSRFKKKK